MLEKLTPEQEALIPIVRDEWINRLDACPEIDREKAEAGIKWLYSVSKLKEPKVIFVSSPLGAQYAANMIGQVDNRAVFQVWAQVWDQVWAQVWDQVWAQVGAQVGDQVWDQVWAQVGDQVGAQVRDQVWAQVRDQVWDQVWAQVRDQVGDQVYRAAYGAQDMGWVAWFRAMQAIGVNLPKSADTIAAVSENVGWWWPFENAVIVTERPCVIKFDGEKRLHCETGPAVEYRDGFGVYAWRGIRIPPEWIKDGPPDAISCLRVENIEQRRIACEMRGWHNILPKLPNAKLIDKHSNPQVGELWQGDLPDHGKERFLQVKCGTGRTFAIPVGMEFSTAREANAATYGIAPQILDQLEVRT